MYRAVIYCRCSTEEESQQDALAGQIIESRQCVLKKDWKLVDEYIEAKSGTTTVKRNEYNRLYEDLQHDKFDIVVIKSQDRLMRNTKDWYLFIDRLVTNEKQLFMYMENKFYSADDALITGIKAILAEEYSKELSKKINNAHYHRQQDGRKFILPSQTYGLKSDSDGTIVIIPEEAEAIQIMFSLCKSMGCISIEHYLEENQIYDRNGEPFKEAAIRRIIRNPIRCGTVIQNQRHFDFQTKKIVKVPREEWVVHKNAVPPVVSEKIWQEANDAMDKRTEKRNQKAFRFNGKNPGKYQLSGKIKCGECGSPYYRRCRKSNRDEKIVIEWKCRRYIQKGRKRTELKKESGCKTDIIPKQGCNNIHLNEERLFHLLEAASKEYYNEIKIDDVKITAQMLLLLSEVFKQNHAGIQIERVIREKERYEQQKKKLLDKLINEVISDAIYKEKELEINQKISTSNQQLTKLKNEENEQESQEQRIKDIRKLLEKKVVRQAIIEEMIDSIGEIKVYPNKLIIEYRLTEITNNGHSVPESIRNTAQNISKNIQIEAALDADFRYPAKKDAENQRIMEYMRNNPQITAKLIAKREGISLSTANSRIRSLRRQGKIHFEGRGGHGRWIVTHSGTNNKNSKTRD